MKAANAVNMTGTFTKVRVATVAGLAAAILATGVPTPARADLAAAYVAGCPESTLTMIDDKRPGKWAFSTTSASPTQCKVWVPLFAPGEVFDGRITVNMVADATDFQNACNGEQVKIVGVEVIAYVPDGEIAIANATATLHGTGREFTVRLEHSTPLGMLSGDGWLEGHAVLQRTAGPCGIGGVFEGPMAVVDPVLTPENALNR